MANAKTYNDLNQATEVNDTDKIALAQSGKQELVTATVDQVATKVADIVSTDQVTEIVTDLGLGKQVLAQKLNDKGAEVTASDTLVQMAAKVDPLDVVGAKEYVIGNVVTIEQASYGVGSYGMRIPLTKYFICFTSASAPYTIGLYGPNADETAMELKSSLVLEALTSLANPSNSYWTFCSNPKYVLFSNSKQQFMLEISDSAELSLKWTHTISTNSPEVPMLVSRDGNNYVTNYDNTWRVRNNEGTLIKSSSAYTGYASYALEFYMDEDNTNFFGTHSGVSAHTFTGTVDWVTGSFSLSIHGDGISKFSDRYGISCTDIKNKKVIKICSYSSITEIPSEYFYAYDITTGGLEYSVPLYFNRIASSGKTSLHAYMCGCIEYDSDNNPLVYTDAGCFTYDIMKKSVSIQYGDNVYKQKLVLNTEVSKLNSNSYANNTGYRGGFFLNTRIQFLSIVQESRAFNRIGQPNTSYGTPTYLGKQVCTGLIYKRNGQEALFKLSSWSDADYEAGAYDVDNTKAEVEI